MNRRSRDAKYRHAIARQLLADASLVARCTAAIDRMVQDKDARGLDPQDENVGTSSAMVDELSQAVGRIAPDISVEGRLDVLTLFFVSVLRAWNRSRAGTARE